MHTKLYLTFIVSYFMFSSDLYASDSSPDTNNLKNIALQGALTALDIVTVGSKLYFAWSVLKKLNLLDYDPVYTTAKVIATVVVYKEIIRPIQNDIKKSSALFVKQNVFPNSHTKLKSDIESCNPEECDLILRKLNTMSLKRSC